MKEKERVIVTGLVVLMLILWLGFTVHVSPWFAGSFWGGVLGVSGAVLMLVPLAYLVVKRVRKLKKVVTKRVSMRTLLAWHIYAGVVGPILVLLHTGHKFESYIGIALTGMTLVVVLSGFVGRYLMGHISRDVKEKKAMLAKFQGAYAEVTERLARQPEHALILRPFAGFFSRLAAALFLPHAQSPYSGRFNVAETARLVDSMADVEYAVKTHERFKAWFAKWLKVHIWISLVLYLLLVLHIWASIHFGLRWFE